MKINKISIVIPCYNEKETIAEIIARVKEFDDYLLEIIIVDDCSNDGSSEILKNLNDPDIKIIFHNMNFGKGKSLQTGFAQCTGDIIIIQDADLEYNPKDYSIILKPFEETNADVVYGSRFLGGSGYSRVHYYYHFIANKLLTHFCNIFSNLNMTDMETGYKAFRANVIKSQNLKEKSFGFEPEITIKLAKAKYKFYEVPISYNGRSYEEGKKITIKDAFRAVYCIMKYRFFD
jgi:glycosyltransferase involved in cell wall biosynthesis